MTSGEWPLLAVDLNANPLGSVASTVGKIENLRRGHEEMGVDAPPAERVGAAFSEHARAI